MDGVFYITAAVLLLSQAAYGQLPCPKRWIHNEGTCYYLGNEKVRFSEAAQVCQLMKSELLRINDAAEEQFISSHFLSTLKSDLWNCGSGSIDEWKCEVDNATVSYLNWVQPRKHDASSNKTCISISFEQNGKMEEVPCKTKQRFLCEKRVVTNSISATPATTGERKTRASASAMSNAYAASLSQMALSISSARAFDNGRFGGALGFSMNTQIGTDGSRSVSAGNALNFGGAGLAPHVTQDTFSQTTGPMKDLIRRSVEADTVDESDPDEIEASLSNVAKMLEVSPAVMDIANGDINEPKAERDFNNPSSYYPYYAPYSPYTPYSPYSSYYPSSYSPQLSSAQTQAMSLTPTGQSLSLSGAHGLDLGVVGVSLAYSTNFANNPRSTAFNTNFGVNVGSPLFPKISFGTSANNANTQGRKKREEEDSFEPLDEADQESLSRLPSSKNIVKKLIN